jgi:hypothetical protein
MSLAGKLNSLFGRALTTLNRDIEENMRGSDEGVIHTVRLKMHDLLAFAIDYSIRANLKPKESAAVREILFVFLSGDASPYWESLARIPDDRRFGRSRIEYLMVGNTFLEECGRTGIQEMDDAIRVHGANAFLRVSEAAKNEIKQVRVALPGI